ncbi:hypothetical protein FN846DRAFT_584101 [Sphaerosporella brunnea]|uniref:Uncharacterized protein n=1 Tax=Sphaerosporella brunnea TaxID=1250544 RepID=A0A5J5F2C2_9PEZI|nr:hypothetical protein FN846DRAFT_584101 [Sphaerosporella brunnea]
MSTTINPILTSLDVASLNFTQNCTAVGELFGAQSKSEFTTDITPNFLQLGLPAEYRDSFSDSDLQTYIDDYLYRPGSNFTRAMGQGKVSDARNVCSKEICQTAYGSFTGNPDIAGIGMMVAYGLQIVLFTVGCFIHFVGYIIKKKLKGSRSHLPLGLLEGARPIFLDTTIGFSIPMSIATMIFAASAQNLYELAFATIVPIISAAPAIPTVASGLGCRGCRPRREPLMERPQCRPGCRAAMERPRFRFLLAALTAVLGAGGAGAASIVGLVDRTKYPDYRCDAQFFGTDGTLIFMGVFPLIYLACSIPHLVCVAYLVYGKVGFGPGRQKIWEKAAASFIFISIVYGWCGLIILMLLRIGLHKMAGADYSENQWGFGQIVAVGLWLPVFVEWVYIRCL